MPRHTDPSDQLGPKRGGQGAPQGVRVDSVVDEDSALDGARDDRDSAHLAVLGGAFALRW
jgi:hypothetical protein